MRRALLLFALLAVVVPARPVEMKMWGCKPLGQRRNALYLADRGADSYVKMSGQRVPARLTSEDPGQRWTWGSNSVLLGADGAAEYFEGDALKLKLKCKRMGDDD